MKIFAVIIKEIIHIKRDIRVLYFSLIWPVFLLILFGYTVNFDVKNIRLAYFDFDGKKETRELLNKFRASGLFNVIPKTDFSWHKSQLLLDKGKANLVIFIPDGFGKKINRQEKATFQILIDGSDNNTARILLGYISGITQNYYQEKLIEHINRLGLAPDNFELPVNYSMRFLYNPSLRGQNFIVPGLIAVIMMIIGTLLTSLTITQEWERGTMEQLLYTPIKPLELILGKLSPYFIISIVQMTLVLLTSMIIFKVPFKGNILLFYFASGLFLLGTLGMGLFLSLITKTQQVAAMLAFLTTFLPAFLLSGFIFPIASMPVILKIITYLVPAKYFLIIIRGIFLKGSGFFPLWTDFVAMLLFSFFFVFISITRFKKRLS